MTDADTNPKDEAAKRKVRLDLIPGPAMARVAQALADGAAKYGPFNWRTTPITASTYLAAEARHVKSWQDGSEFDLESGEHHLAHAIATLLILLDAQICDKLIDDRPPPAPTRSLLDSLARTQKT
jgi:hypothetical protein